MKSNKKAFISIKRKQLLRPNSLRTHPARLSMMRTRLGDFIGEKLWKTYGIISALAV